MSDIPMRWKPNTTVACLAERDGRFLLVEETIGGHTVINQPAGHLEEGESLVQAVIRETLEETGWVFEPQALVGIYRWRSPGENLTFLRYCFTGVCTAHDPDHPLDPQIDRAVWLSVEELRGMEHLRSPMVMRCIDDYLAGSRHSLDLLVDLDA
jgi:8-oxo-dGTP pyrophosphatase MutT (NUDIX family)